MKLTTFDHIKGVLNNCNILVITTPFSIIDNDVKDFNKSLMALNKDSVKLFVDTLIDNNIFNIFIALYNVDSTKFYKKCTTEELIEIKANINKVLNGIYIALFNAYKDRKFTVAIQGKFIPTPKSITRAIIDSNLFGISHTDIIHFDGRKDNPLFNTELQNTLTHVTKHIACCILSNKDVIDEDSIEDVLNEDSYDKCLFDIITYSFIPPDNSIAINIH